MRNKKIELDVDTIGEQGRSLTKEEEQAISQYIRSKQKHKVKRNIREAKVGSHKKVV